MSDNDTGKNGGIPPKIDLRKTGLIPNGVEGGPAAKKQTARLDLSSAVDASGKKRTSRIELESALPAGAEKPAVQAAPKTIRIKRPPAPMTVPAPPVAEPAAVDSEKKQTSRIPLEAAISATATPEPETAPPTSGKTIRLRRPGQPPPTLKLIRPEGGPAAAEVPAAAEQPAVEKSQTSRIEIPPEAEAAAAPTQRKTIKIRRPEGPVAGPLRTLTVARPPEAPEAAGAALPEKDVGVVFSILAIAAALIACALLYVLAAQAFPNLGLALPGQVRL